MESTTAVCPETAPHYVVVLVVFCLLQVVVDPPPVSTPTAGDPSQLRVGARVRLKDKDVYGFVRCVIITVPSFS